MGAKAYVLQLSKNVRRSNEQKNKNGEITGLAPLGYENYIDERGKHFVRQKQPDATIIRKCYEMYSLGRASVAEIQHYANMIGLRTRKGAPISVNTMHFILENPFYYGEMKTKRGLMPHVYQPLVSKELKQKMDALFDMHLDGELDRETFDLKRNEIQVKITRLNNKIVAHEKADNSFDETILGLLDIATQAGYIFEKSSNVDLKRLLLKFVFENITLTEGVISYKLRFPFNEFANLTTPKRNRPTPYEPTPSLISLGVRANNNQNVQSGYMNFCEPQFTDKNQGVTLKNATPLQSGWGGRIRTYECRHQKPMPYHLATPH